VSDHVATFGGLLIKEESIEKGLLDSFDPSVDPTTGEEVDLAFLASRNVIINEWRIDPALLMLPAETSRPMVSHNTFVQPPISHFSHRNLQHQRERPSRWTWTMKGIPAAAAPSKNYEH
jgi:hypothetical protein